MIEIDNPSPEQRDWLRRGILIPVKETPSEVATAPLGAETAVTRRGGGGRPRTRPAAEKANPDEGGE